MEVAAEIQNIAIALLALLIVVLALTCICVHVAAKATKVRTIDREKVKAAAERYGGYPPTLLPPEYDSALVGYVHDGYVNSVRAVYSAELLEALAAIDGNGDYRARLVELEFFGKIGAIHPLVIHTK